MQLTTVFFGHLEMLALKAFDLFSLFRGLYLSAAGIPEVFYLEPFHFQLKSTG